MKLWSGRFSKELDSLVNDFNSSIQFDGRMYEEDITGSIAHATMLGKTGIIAQSEADKIVCALKEICDDIASGKLELTPDNEDIHMNVETALTARLGDTGKRLHTARSRNDQVALDFKLYLKKEILEIKSRLIHLEKVLAEQAKKYTRAVLPGYTHLQRAQPSTAAHHFMAYGEMFKRDITRLEDCFERMNYSPLGSGALAGTTYPIDREMVASLLGFAGVTNNSLDGVSDRDYAIELLSAISIIMMHLSRFSEEMILWCSWEFSYMELDDAYSTGSSIMPQKKNPDIAELVRGKTGRVYGSLMALLTVMKGLPLAYNKDMQEDKESVFDAVDTVKMCLDVFAPMLETMRLKPQNLRNAASRGFINATDCADYLVKKGLPFRDAYTVVGQLVAACIEKGIGLEELPLSDYKAKCDVFDEDVYTALNLENCVNGRTSLGGPAESEVLRQIALLETFIKDHEEESK
ncbi:MAG: argininosuccinate lyase [Oscillospiraceae bacterium]|nr:argininosuccinate lyase [Oscillospiraceae bacterium]